ncbi:expressed protein [Phakopsora pachyrhizi]|uniref:Expressed protein n=1 Tax=Phakopsora pachyrhizi TaxID=170000 RepID=A0AAV0AGA7_PHAPC|nr:expressed protein [Phakopsora pachyrhizi]
MSLYYSLHPTLSFKTDQSKRVRTNHEGVVRQIASLPNNPVSEDSVHAHIAKSQGMRQLGQQGARDPKAVVLVSPPPLPGRGTSADAEGETNPNYALSPGVPLKRILPQGHQSSVAPSPIPPTLLKKKEYHHPTPLGGFLGTNPYGPRAYIGVPSQVSSPKLPGPFAMKVYSQDGTRLLNLYWILFSSRKRQLLNAKFARLIRPVVRP